jgi:uncharacterized Zn finger protein (UPF0148 family)
MKKIGYRKFNLPHSAFACPNCEQHKQEKYEEMQEDLQKQRSESAAFHEHKKKEQEKQERKCTREKLQQLRRALHSRSS